MEEKIENVENIHFDINLKNSHQKRNEGSHQSVNEKSLPLNLDILDRKISSDSTSFSISQIENLSQTSESSLLNSCILNPNFIVQRDPIIKNDKEEINYFYGVEDYFYEIMPDKFYEYKKTKNYLPKFHIKSNEDKEKKNSQNDEEKKYIQDDKDINNIKKEGEAKINKEKDINEGNNFKQFQQNNLYYPMFNNIFFYNYNIYYYNYPYIQMYNNNLNQENSK